MSSAAQQLTELAEELKAFVRSSEEPVIERLLVELEEAATTIGKAWSGSLQGYQAYVYYNGLIPPPPGHNFSIEWGLDSAYGHGTHGDWREYDPDEVRHMIREKAGNPDLEPAAQIANRGRELFEHVKATLLSVLELANSSREDKFLTKLSDDAEEIHIQGAMDYVNRRYPARTFVIRDMLAMNQSRRVPPHIALVAEVAALCCPRSACKVLIQIVQKAASHLERVERDQRRKERIGTNVFIGHGRSLLWKDLKDFVQERLRLPFDEFNRVPIAGITNIARLSDMLDAAAVAFVILTAEDELKDGTTQARMNVIHEAGLFQGRLGFTKAIVLLEDGCEEFSNIQGLGQIRFPKGNIEAFFEDIRQVLEREGLLEAGA
jgi:predicted nucleotide-binding protein